MKIFLSHSSTDKPLLRELKRYLAPGLQGWLDERELEWGADLKGCIKDAIHNSDLFILFLDERALESDWVMRELEWASDKERNDESIFVLPIVMPKTNQENIPKGLKGRLFLTLHDTEESSVKSLAEQINSRILRMLINKYDSIWTNYTDCSNFTIVAQSRIAKYISCSEKVEHIRNSKAKKQLTRVLDAASQLMYVVVGAPQIYHHDHEILKEMDSGDTYRATHPFSANKKAHYVQSVQFKAYIQAQIQAANRGANIKRLYILPSSSLDDLNELEIKHLNDINNEMIDSRITYLSDIPDNDYGEDFVIFDNNLLGVAVPKKGEMLGSEYRYSIDDDSETIERYSSYFDLLFNAATPLEGALRERNVTNREASELNIEKKVNVKEPAFILQTAVSVNDKESSRLMVVLRTAGCAYDQNNMGCTMCDFKRHAANRSEISSSVLMQQLQYALNQAMFGPEDVSQIDLLTLGSFLHEKEVPATFRERAFRELSTIEGIKKIVIESRSPYIKEKTLLRLKELLREEQILEIGLGIESSNETIRNDVLRKNLSDAEIRRVVDVCAKTGVEFLAYLLIGSMTLEEDEAVHDAIASANYIATLCKLKNVKFRIAFEPVFITHGTELEDMFIQGNYNLINLWEVINVIKSASNLGPIFVGLSDEGLSSNRTPRGCPKCTDNLKEAIERFNGSQSLEEFDGLRCECQT